MKKLIICLSSIILLSFNLIACSSKEENKKDPDTSITLTSTLTGTVQKGPFISGASINFFELGSNFVQTGLAYNTQTINNVGNFELSKGLSLTSSNLLFVAQGFYFNEVSGANSEVPLTLYLVSDISNQNNININLITTLEKSRVLYLISEGATYSDADAQARKDVLNIFFISKEDMADAQNLNIISEGDDNAILLAISVILQSYRTTSELSSLISDIALDIEKDGVLDNEKLGSELINGAILLNTQKVRENLGKFYSDNGISVSIPNFEKYVELFINNNAVSAKPYVFTKSMIYPELDGVLLNILNKDITTDSFPSVGTGNFHTGLSVELPNGSRLKIVITALEGVTFSIKPEEPYSNPSSVLNHSWILNNQLSSIITTETLTTDPSAFGIYSNTFQWFLPEKYNRLGAWEIKDMSDEFDIAKFEYYENGSTSPTFTKTIHYVPLNCYGSEVCGGRDWNGWVIK